MVYLAGRFSFLDRGFAAYFQSVVPTFDRAHVKERLKYIRQGLARRQNSNSSSLEHSGPLYLGDLGEFCEDVTKTWNGHNGELPNFNGTHRRDQEIFEYLQDAFEVPYWELMLDIFLQWRNNSRSLSGDVVLKVLESLKREIKTGYRQLLEDIHTQSKDSPGDLAPIIEGIDARIAVLDTV
ncbi:hypothetical protein N7495_007303 [Penicillium taxi]|uniref:uncharacterized protein n=1 Tax=Penicillium taxi TaxID=168475 RepID=UPI002545936B|nr:uncharacterized protein N7495_007303 [Penicillium taxi]KAJ5895612.1 hypothetical protein N7495_007303 [Penicillium taxi]